MNDEYEHPTPSDGHDYHVNFLKEPMAYECPVCQEGYDNHDCHQDREDGCQTCVDWQEAIDLHQLRIDHVQGDVDEQMREEAREKAEIDEYYELHPRPEDVY